MSKQTDPTMRRSPLLTFCVFCTEFFSMFLQKPIPRAEIGCTQTGNSRVSPLTTVLDPRCWACLPLLVSPGHHGKVADWGCPKRREVRFLSSGVGGAGSFGGGVGAPAPGLSLLLGACWQSWALLPSSSLMFSLCPVSPFYKHASHTGMPPPHPLQRLFLN